jgi:hypothetical protein
MLLGFVSVSQSHSHDPADVMKKSPKEGSQKPKVVERERESSPRPGVLRGGPRGTH